MGGAYKYEFSIELPQGSVLPQEPEGLTIGSVLAGITENLRRPISELRWLDASIHEKLFLVERMSARRGLYVPNDIRSFLFEQNSISWDEKRRVVEERLERYARPYGNGELDILAIDYLGSKTRFQGLAKTEKRDVFLLKTT